MTLRMLLLMCVVPFTLGCGSSPSAMYTTGGNFRGGSEPAEEKTEYTAGQHPCLCIVGPPDSNSHDVEIRVYRNDVAEPVHVRSLDTNNTRGQTISVYGTRIGYFESGDFRVDLRVDGKVVSSCNYHVAERVPPPPLEQ